MIRRRWFAGLLALIPLWAQAEGAVDAAPKPAPAPAQARAPVKAPSESAHTTLAKRVPSRARIYYEGVWGVDSLTVKYTESGEIIRFSYRVMDPEKAAPLNDAKAEPSLIDPQAGVKLEVPQMPNIGKLRQTGSPIAGKSYWIAFSNSGRRVRRGDRVDVEIGNFRAQGLVID